VALAISILGFLGILVPIVWALWQRNANPDAQQRLDDIDRRMEGLRDKIAVARCHGDDAGVDAYVRQLLDLSVEREALRDADSQGQRRDD
jgi:hypothetical protein